MSVETAQHGKANAVAGVLEWTCLLAALAVAAVAMIPYGGNVAWAGPAIASGGLVIGALAILLWARQPDSNRQSQVARWPVALFALAALFAYLQSLPLVDWWVRQLSPGAVAAQAYAQGGATTGAVALGLDRHAASGYALQALGYLGLLVSIVVCARTRARLRVVAWGLLAIGLAQALFGLWSRLTGYDFVPRLLRDGHFEIASGTFVNRNHFAALLAMAVCVAAGLLLARARASQRGSGVRRYVARFAEFALDGRGALVALMTVLVAAMAFSGSRGGALSLAVALTFAAAWRRFASGDSTGGEGRVLWLLGGAVVLAGLWLGFGVLGERASELATVDTTRVRLWRLTAGMITGFWLVGAGAGSFPVVFPGFRDGSLPPLVVEHAHNDYLELLAETGLVGFSLTAAAFAACAMIFLQALRTRRDPLVRGLVFAALAGMSAMLLQAVVEFNFRIPALNAYLSVLIGMGLAAAALPSERKGRRRAGIVFEEGQDTRES